MSYFLFFTLKSHLLSHQTENIILAAKLYLMVLIFTKHKKYVLQTRQYAIINVKYTKQNCILCQF